ncbi:MAG: hypothetical protein OXB88_00335 [Bacteriovoracales bacterium]|nr:hypothetical protein [Bacteriovoracales bacterium]
MGKPSMNTERALKALINTFGDRVGNALVPINFYIEKIDKGHDLNSRERKALKEAYERLEKIVNKFRKLDPSHIKISLDKLGLLETIDLPD